MDTDGANPSPAARPAQSVPPVDRVLRRLRSTHESFVFFLKNFRLTDLWVLLAAVPRGLLSLVKFVIGGLIVIFVLNIFEGPGNLGVVFYVSVNIAFAFLVIGLFRAFAIPFKHAATLQRKRIEIFRLQVARQELGFAGRAEQLSQLLDEAQELLVEMQTEMDLRVSRLKLLQAEQETQQREIEMLERVQKLNMEQTHAITQFMQGKIAEVHRQLEVKADKKQWVFFIAGMAFSIPLGLFVNWLFDQYRN